MPPPHEVTLKDPKDWKLIGTPATAAAMCRDKVTGKPIYAIDVRLPGMLYARHRAMPGLQGHAEVGR